MKTSANIATHTSRRPLAQAINMAGALGLTALLTLSGCSDDASKANEDVSRMLERAEVYLQQGQFKASLIEAQNAAQRDASNAQPPLALAKVYIALGQGKLALRELDKLKQDSSPSTALMRARALLQQGKHQSATALLEPLEATIPAELKLEYSKLRAECALAQGAFDVNQLWYERAQALAPKDVSLLTDMAKAALVRNDQPSAEMLLGEALNLEPENPAARVIEARMAIKNGRVEEAEDSLTRALAGMPKTDLLTPLRAQALELIIEVLSKQGRSAEALVYSKALNEANPEGAMLKSKYEEAMAAYKAGDLEQAKKLLNELEQQAPGNPFSSTMLGVINYFQGNLSDAQRHLSSNFDPETAAPGAMELLASTQLRLNQPEKVLEMFGEQSVKEINNAQLLALYGIAALQTGRGSEGVAAIDKALALAPERASLRLTLAAYYNSTNQADKALEQLQAAYQAAPHDVGIVRELMAQHVRMGKKAEADTAIKKLLENRPSDVDAQNLAAQYNLAQGNVAQAEEHYNIVLKQDAANAAAKFGLANIALRQKAPDKAAVLFDQIIASEPGAPTAYKGKISALELQGKSNEIVPQLEQLAETHAKLATPLAVLAEYLIRNGKPAEASEVIKRAQEREPNSSYVLEISAQVTLVAVNELRGKKEYEKARALLMEALPGHPQDSRFLAMLARIEMESGRAKEAEKIIDQIASLYPKAALSHELRGDLKMQTQNAQEAITSYQAAWQLAKFDSLAQKLAAALGRVDVAQAVKFTQEWQQALPKSPTPLILLASEAQQRKDTQAAIGFYEQAIERAPNAVAALNNLAWLYFEAGDRRAAALAERAYNLAPQEAAIADTYGWILFKQGDTAKGLSVLQEAAKLAPDNAEIQQHVKEAQAR